MSRWLRTVRNLDAAQVAHRARLRGQRAAVAALPAVAGRVLRREVPGDVGWPRDFVPLDAWLSWPAPEHGRITLLGRAGPVEWEGDAPQLWRYHLHYWDWAWGLAGDGGRRAFESLWSSWSASTAFGRGDAWHPYVASLRAWSLCGVYDALVRGGPLESEVRESLGLHAGFLATHLERDVRGNHLVKNLKALAGLGVFLRDDALLRRAVVGLLREVDRQVLADGGHYERAPAYHCQVMADLADVAALARVPRLDAVVGKMRGWLAQMVLPDGTVPLLNDGFPVDPDLLRLLLAGAPPASPFAYLADSGYVVTRAGRFHLVADVGLPCPDELPAHAHADTLSFLLYDEDLPVVVDTGTSTYAPGARRDLERSTAAHSTVEVDGLDSTEVYGAFRAGRRARPIVDEVTPSLVRASHDGYRHLPGAPVHHRTWELSEQRLRVTDTVTGSRPHAVTSRLVLAPDIEMTRGKVGGLRFDADRPAAVAEWRVATGWERTRETSVLLRDEVRALPVTTWMELSG